MADVYKRQAIEYVHLHGRKLYLTVNTLLKEEELTQQLYDYLLPYYEMGLDAVIVQDLGVLSFVRRAFPDLHVHASTQMTVTGALGAGLLKELGVCRVVAARELSLRELKEISEETGLELEAFVHGSICYCYSGQCLYSSMIGGRSGNRGRCAQPCRLPYEVTAVSYTHLAAFFTRKNESIWKRAGLRISLTCGRPRKVMLNIQVQA